MTEHEALDGAVKEKVSSELEPGRMRRGQACNPGGAPTARSGKGQQDCFASRACSAHKGDFPVSGCAIIC